jgi:hypothetical protein
VRFDGSMNVKKRQAVLDAFSRPLVSGYDSDATEPESDDERYQEYWAKRKGKGKAQAGNIVRRSDNMNGENPVVMLISLKVWYKTPVDARTIPKLYLQSGSLGLNCTVANNVFLMDP